MVPSNVECLADYIHPKAEIQERAIYFKSTKHSELFLRVPIESPDSAIVVTLGFDNSYLNKHDSRLTVHIHDYNIRSIYFHIENAGVYHTYPPCYPDVPNRDNTLVSEGTKAPSIVKLTFLPLKGFGYCETAQEGGYTNAGKFSEHMTGLYPLYLELYSWQEEEEHSIYHISIESI